jgi:hypothetical protein
MSESTDRPLTASEAAEHFAHERKLHGARSALMEEAKMDIETMVDMINMVATKSIRKQKAREFAAAFGIDGDLLPAIETLFYGDLDARVQAGRELWKWCDATQKAARE